MTDDNDDFEITYEKVKRFDNLWIFRYVLYGLIIFFFIVWILELILTFEPMSALEFWKGIFYDLSTPLLFGIFGLISQIFVLTVLIDWKNATSRKIFLFVYVLIMIFGLVNSLMILMNLFI